MNKNNSKMTAGIVLLVAVVLTTGCQQLIMKSVLKKAEPAPAAPPAGVSVERDIVYAETEDGPLALDVLLPDPLPEEKLPVVVYVFGGGWMAGNKHQVQVVQGNALPLEGFAVVSPNYRLSQEANFPAQIHDIKATIRWVRSNADRYGFDTEAIGVWGMSAGGQLASLLAVTPDHAELEGNVGGDVLDVFSSHVHAVVEYFGPTDFIGDLNDNLAQMVEPYLGGPVSEKQPLAELASPAFHVTQSDASRIPPFLIVHGDKDKIVPMDQSINFHKQLIEAGVDSTLHIIPGAGHGSEKILTEEYDEVVSFFRQHLQSH